MAIQKWYTYVISVVCFSVLLLNYGISPGYAEDSDEDAVGFFIHDADSQLINGVYQLSADIEYNFSDNVLSAIQNGVPIIIVLDVEMLQIREYVWNKLVAELKQRYKLQFHAISEQYIVENLNSGSLETFPTLHSALYTLRQIKALPIIDKKLLQSEKKYNSRARVRIELESLPVPLRLNAYITRSWWLGSGWFEWEL